MAHFDRLGQLIASDLIVEQGKVGLQGTIEEGVLRADFKGFDIFVLEGAATHCDGSSAIETARLGAFGIDSIKLVIRAQLVIHRNARKELLELGLLTACPQVGINGGGQQNVRDDALFLIAPFRADREGIRQIIGN